MTDEQAAQLRAQVHDATRVLSGSYTISQQRQAALTEEYAETFAAAVERLLDERAAHAREVGRLQAAVQALVTLVRGIVPSLSSQQSRAVASAAEQIDRLLAGEGEQQP